MLTTDPYIWVLDNALDPDFCAHLINKFEEDTESQHEGLVGDWTVKPEVKSSQDLFLSDKPNWVAEDRHLYQNLQDNIVNYQNHIGTQLNLNPDMQWHPLACTLEPLEKGDVGYQIQRTQPGKGYIWHTDYMLNFDHNRLYTFIWYLNTITEEGYTEFYNGIKVQPQAGRLLIFTATWTYVHRGVPPKSGVKYICTGWVHGKIPKQ